MVIGERVKARLEAENLSQAELARRVGVSQPTIYGLIHSNKIGTKYLHLVARELRTTPAYLSGETDDPDADAPSPPEYTPDERAWVDYWRALDGDGRDAMVRVVRLLTAGRTPDRASAGAGR